MSKEKKAGFRLPHVLTLIFILTVVIAILSWILPSGQFDYELMDTAAGEREVAVAGTYHVVEKVAEDGTDLRQGLAQVLMAPGRGIQSIVEVLAFVFIIGGGIPDHGKDQRADIGHSEDRKETGDKGDFDHSDPDGALRAGWKHLRYVGRAGAVLHSDHADHVCHGI